MIGRSEDFCNVFDTGTPQAILNRSLPMAHALLVGIDEITGKAFDYVIIGSLLRFIHLGISQSHLTLLQAAEYVPRTCVKLLMLINI